MKYCEEYAALLDLFVDGELAPEEMERVRAHLAACPGCRAYVDDALAIRAGFPDVEDTEVPEGFAGEIMERIREDAGKSAKIVELRRRSLRRWAGTLGALAACCALAVLVRTGSGGLSGGSDSASMVTASSGGAPASYAMDTAGAEESAENGEIAPQTAMEAVEVPAEAAEAEEGARQTGGQAETRMTAAYRGGADAGALEKEDGFSADNSLPAAASPAGTMPESVSGAAGDTAAALYLTAEEAGDLLSGYTAAWENAVEWGYELNGEEYRALLEALGRQEERKEAAEGLFLVVVARPLE